MNVCAGRNSMSALAVLTRVTFSPPPEVAWDVGAILPPDLSLRTTAIAAAALP